MERNLRAQECGPPLTVRPCDAHIVEFDLSPPGTVASVELLQVMSWIPGMEMLRLQAMVVRLAFILLIHFPQFLMCGRARLRVEFVHVPIFLR